eukprot:CAMPEP_0115020438 /NCGR_PEP_ID=MMETSP0216-20121206/30133_1 /TAXON_ID=223996 /ORGANISM="Protocruzia adherens, Strain Boccale" /LENGTH=300 /DNA_ID=CAMNT_0002392287 /DNA_START=14 /DNA_END=916 /DNA_ORIENTATION=-
MRELILAFIIIGFQIGAGRPLQDPIPQAIDFLTKDLGENFVQKAADTLDSLKQQFEFSTTMSPMDMRAEGFLKLGFEHPKMEVKRYEHSTQIFMTPANMSDDFDFEPVFFKGYKTNRIESKRIGDKIAFAFSDHLLEEDTHCWSNDIANMRFTMCAFYIRVFYKNVPITTWKFLMSHEMKEGRIGKFWVEEENFYSHPCGHVTRETMSFSKVNATMDQKKGMAMFTISSPFKEARKNDKMLSIWATNMTSDPPISIPITEYCKGMDKMGSNFNVEVPMMFANQITEVTFTAYWGDNEMCD